MLHYKPVVQSLSAIKSRRVDVLRLDLLDAEISGNKWFKLKRNLEKAQKQNHDTLLTFGGAHSNHIAATAAAAKRAGLKAIGIIRGSEENAALNPTLEKAQQEGMQLYFVSRELYKQKDEAQFRSSLESRFGRHYLIPEGGNNVEGAMGCTEILQPIESYDLVFCACGTATTYAGLLASAGPGQKVIGVSVLRGENKLPAEASALLQEMGQQDVPVAGNEALEKEVLNEHAIISSYAFSGYAAYDAAIVAFKQRFESDHGIPLDHVYTSKLFYAVCDLLETGRIKKEASVLIVHSGGLQGNAGFEQRYHLKLRR